MARSSSRLRGLLSARRAAAPEDALPAAAQAQAETLFRLAQLVTPDSTAAANLVEATYRRAPRVLRESSAAGDASVGALFRVMAAAREEHGYAKPGERGGEGLASVRGDLADRLFDRLLPAVLATLPEPERVLLVAVDGEGLALADAAALLGIPPEIAQQHLAEVRRRAASTIRASATLAERKLVAAPYAEASADSDALTRALQRFSRDRLAPFPMHLGSAIATAAAPRQPAPSPRGAAAARAEPKAGSGMRRVAFAIATVLAAGMIGAFGSRLLERTPETSIVALTAGIASERAPEFVTASAEEAELHVRLELGRRVTVPEIAGASLVGVTIAEVAPGVRVPELHYASQAESARAAPILLYAYAYVQLEQQADRLSLERSVLAQIEEAGRFHVYDPGAQKMLLWRHRDDIFVAVYEGDAEALQTRITFPS